MTSPEITIRKAVASEAERLADIALLAWERDLQPFLSGEAASRANEKRRLGIAVHELLDRTIVAEINGSPVGWCARARSRPDNPYRVVTPSRQKHGHGSQQLRRREANSELEGADKVQLDTLSDNVRAVNFYPHQGYRILVLKREGATGSDPQTSVRLEKRLSPYRGPLNDDED